MLPTARRGDKRPVCEKQSSYGRKKRECAQASCVRRTLALADGAFIAPVSMSGEIGLILTRRSTAAGIGRGDDIGTQGAAGLLNGSVILT